ncbi:MAG: hypothetical protein K6T66_08385 [Peptococcaceae bacterium]|nr:hypothetical protein [Peptococcaceae bacterium]
MQARPVVLVQPPGEGGRQEGDGIITAIAVYSGEAPLSVATRRVFDGETRFKFPTEISEGMNKTRVVYSYTADQWRELLQACVLPQAQGGIKQIMIPLLMFFREAFPGGFDDIEFDRGYDPGLYAEIVRLK